MTRTENVINAMLVAKLALTRSRIAIFVVQIDLANHFAFVGMGFMIQELIVCHAIHNARLVKQPKIPV